jgi:hypothetical protein
MKKRISILLITCILIMTFVGCSTSVSASSPYIPTEDLDILHFFADINAEIENLLHRQYLAHQMAECARELGYEEDSEVILAAKVEWHSCEDLLQGYMDYLTQWNQRFDEYPYATYTWLYLTQELGYSNYVAAGILGNIMAEVGGNTLEIQYWLYSYGSGYYYGICQWSRDTYPDVRGEDLIFQCDYLAKTIEYELNTFGYAYQSGYGYADFLQLESVEDTALMFAKCYERCAKSTYSVRQKNATKAYDYFMGLC